MAKNYERYLEIMKNANKELGFECEGCERLSFELDNEMEEEVDG